MGNHTDPVVVMAKAGIGGPPPPAVSSGNANGHQLVTIIVKTKAGYCPIQVANGEVVSPRPGDKQPDHADAADIRFITGWLQDAQFKVVR